MLLMRSKLHSITSIRSITCLSDPELPDRAPDLGLQAEAEELKKQIEELSSRLSTLTAEKNQLQNRNSLLEKVVQVRGGGGDASVPAQV